MEKKEEKIIHIKENDLMKLKEAVKKTKELKKENEELRKNIKELQERCLRIMAEFDNYRKRVEREKQEIYKYGAENLLRQLLQFDNIFENILKQMELKPSSEAIHKGMKLLKKEFTKLLEANGVKKIEVKGKKFDPNIHEAIGVIETNEVEEGEIVEEEQPGYVYHDKILKPSLVKVAKKPKTDENSCTSKN